MGTAKSAPAMALSPTPRTVSIWRRETLPGLGEVWLPALLSLVGSAIGILLVAGLLLGGGDGIRLAGSRYAMGGQPGYDIGHLLRGHWLVGDAIAPIGMAEVGTPGNNGRAQALVGDKSEIGPIHN